MRNGQIFEVRFMALECDFWVSTVVCNECKTTICRVYEYFESLVCCSILKKMRVNRCDFEVAILTFLELADVNYALKYV